MLAFDVGDVLVTRNTKGVWPRLIRFGEALRDRPNLGNHVIVVHHQDSSGTWWGIEGRPGGVGWVDLAPHSQSRYTISNFTQPKTFDQRQKVAAATEALLGTEYDWAAIACDALGSLDIKGRLDDLWAQNPPEGTPAHLVCSALADYAYEQVGLDSPRRVAYRYTTPGDWSEFIIEGCNGS